MTRLRRPAIAVFCAASLMVLAVLLALGRDSDRTEHHRAILSTLDAMAQAETGMDRDVLQVLSGLLLHYDTLVQHRNRLSQLFSSLNQFAQADLPGDALETHRQMVAQKLDAMEVIKGAAAFVRHEESYLPHAVGQYADQAGIPPLRVQLAQQALIVVLRPISDDPDTLPDLLTRLEQYQDPLLPSLLTHLRTLRQQQMELRRTVRVYFSLKGDDTLNQLRNAYMARYQQDQIREVWINRALQAVAFLLFVALGWTILRLQQEHHNYQQAHNQLDDAVTSLQEAFALFGDDYSLLISNQGFRQLVGDAAAVETSSDLAAILGRLGWTVDDQGSIPAGLLCSPGETLLVHAATARHLLYRGHATRDGGMVALFTDLTEHKQNEDKIRKLSIAVEQSPLSILITDRAARIEYANPRFLQQSGYSKAELIGANPRILKSGEVDPQVYRQMWAALKSGITWRGELINKRRNGELYWENAVISPVRDGNGVITHYIGLKEDITQQKRNAELLMDASADNERMLFAASHDLQEPSRLVQIYSQLLERQMVGNLPMDVRQSLRYIREGAGQLTLLVRGMVEYSKSNHPTQSFIPVDLGGIAAAAYQDVQDAVSDCPLQIQAQDLPTIMGDPTLLQMMFRNLLENSVKYQRPDIPPVVTVTAHGGNGGWRVDLTDNGIGIDPQYLPTIANPFSRLHPRSSHPGAGLGLASCSKIAKTHGGRMWLDSQPGQGTTVHIWFPRSED